MPSIGIDLVEVERIERALARWPERFPRRLCTEAEWEYCRNRPRPAEALAARFAAKEAALKALGVGLGACAWRDLEVVRRPSGAPALVLAGRAAELARQRGLRGLAVSIAHSKSHAVAVVMAE